MAARKISALKPVHRQLTIVAIARWLASRLVCQAIPSMPDRVEGLVDQAVLVAEEAAEDDRDRDRGDDVGQQDAHPPDGPAAQVLVSSSAARTTAITICGPEDSTKMLRVLTVCLRK